MDQETAPFYRVGGLIDHLAGQLKLGEMHTRRASTLSFSGDAENILTVLQGML